MLLECWGLGAGSLCWTLLMDTLEVLEDALKRCRTFLLLPLFWRTPLGSVGECIMEVQYIFTVTS